VGIMRQWARALGGRLVLSSVPARGTQVTLHLPLDDRGGASSR
jgi:signal transduction histidine kinase